MNAPVHEVPCQTDTAILGFMSVNERSMAWWRGVVKEFCVLELEWIKFVPEWWQRP